MKVTALGHAGLKVETGKATLLCDPWFSPEGTFNASWFQFPDNSHILTPELCRPTAIAISHEHLDHIDPWFLAKVPASVPVIIPHYPSPVLKQKIRKGGERPIIELKQWETHEIAPGFTIYIVSEPPQNHDSAMIISADGQTLLNMNDARLFPIQYREIMQKAGGTIDMFGYQGAGASWYPMCYDYAPERARELSRQKRLAKFAYCRRSLHVVKPVVAFPFAGPPAFLDPELFAYNAEMEAGIFPDQQQVVDWMAEKGAPNNLVLLPGDAWDLDKRVKLADPHWRDFSFRDRAKYLEAYAKRRREHVQAVLDRHPHPTESLWEPFKAYFEGLLAMSPYFNRKINMQVGFDIQGPGGGQWTVDFRPGHEGVKQGMKDCGYTYRFASRWLPELVKGSLPWEDFLLSLRLQASRNPDLYNDHLLGLLKFADRDALKAWEDFEGAEKSDERITIHSEGRVYKVSRYCPHAGNDLLSTGEVLPGGILQCGAHHYDFDLNSGRCINSDCPPLAVELIDDDPHEKRGDSAA
jgi:UDP-MurNAc hydroxylase